MACRPETSRLNSPDLRTRHPKIPCGIKGFRKFCRHDTCRISLPEAIGINFVRKKYLLIPTLPKSRSEWVYLVHAGAIVCSLMICAGFGVMAYSVYWNSKAQSATAVILSYTEDAAGNRNPHIRFADDEGVVHEVTVDVVAPFSEQEGKSLAIRFQPANPTDVKVDRWLDHWFIGCFLSIWGLIWTGMFLLIARKIKRGSDSPQPPSNSTH